MSERDLARSLAELETRFRRLRILTVYLLCVVAAGVLAGWALTAPPASGHDAGRVLRVQRVVLVDSAGERAADLSADASGVEIRLFRPDVELEEMPGGRDAPGEVIDARARITHAPALHLTDGAGNVIGRLGHR